MRKHSELPFHFEITPITYPSIYNKDRFIGTAIKEIDAEFIVNACNSYYESQDKIKTLQERLEKLQQCQIHESYLCKCSDNCKGNPQLCGYAEIR